MKVLAFNGSPRKDGNTAIMLKEALSAISQQDIETELIHIKPMMLKPCSGCNYCRTSGESRCVQDDPLNDWLGEIFTADGLLLGSPTYFFGMHPSLKCLIDRVGYIVRGRITKGERGQLFRKIGGAVAVDASSGAPLVVQTIQSFFMITEMIVPGGIYWPIGKGSKPGDVHEDHTGMRNAKNLGENMAWLIKSIQK